MENASSDTVVKQKWIHILIMLLFFFVFPYLPAVEPITELGMKVIGIFLAVLYGWITIDFTIPSLLGMVMLGLSGAMPTKEIFMTGFGADICIFVIFFLAFAIIVDESGVSNAIAGWFISRKIGIGRPWIFSVLIFLAAYMIGMAISLVATIIIMWNIFYKICQQLQIKEHDPYAMYMLAGIALSATVGYQLFPFKPVPALMVGTYETVTGTPIDFLSYIAISFVISCVSILLYLAFGKFVLRLQMDFMDKVDSTTFSEFREMKMSGYQKLILAFLVGIIILLVLPSMLPKDIMVYKILNTMGSTGIIVTAVCVIGLLRHIGAQKVSLPDMLKKGTQWDVISMMAVMMPLCDVLTSEKTGVMTAIIDVITPIVAGLSGWQFLLILLVTCYVMVQFLGNVAAAAIMVPLLYAFSGTMDFSSSIMLILLAIGINVGYLTPASSTMAALLHGNRTWFDNKNAYFYGGALVVISLIAVSAVGLMLSI